MISCTDPTPLDGLDGYRFKATCESVAGRACDIYRIEDPIGPVVLLMHELPGMSPACIQLARDLSKGRESAPAINVHLPLLFSATGGSGNLNAIRGVFCVRRELAFLRKGADESFTLYLRELVSHLAKGSSSGRVGIIGMCMTGSLLRSTGRCIGWCRCRQPAISPIPGPVARHPRGVKQDLGVANEDMDQAVLSGIPPSRQVR